MNPWDLPVFIPQCRGNKQIGTTTTPRFYVGAENLNLVPQTVQQTFYLLRCLSKPRFLNIYIYWEFHTWVVYLTISTPFPPLAPSWSFHTSLIYDFFFNYYYVSFIHLYSCVCMHTLVCMSVFVCLCVSTCVSVCKCLLCVCVCSGLTMWGWITDSSLSNHWLPVAQHLEMGPWELVRHPPLISIVDATYKNYRNFSFIDSWHFDWAEMELQCRFYLYFFFWWLQVRTWSKNGAI